MGRPAHRPDPVTQRQVEAMAGYGVPEADIAGVIGIDAKTLRKHYRNELDHGHVKANVRVAENLLSYDFVRLPRQTGAAAWHGIYAGSGGGRIERTWAALAPCDSGIAPVFIFCPERIPGFSARMTRLGSG
jgi:hypothetical protein